MLCVSEINWNWGYVRRCKTTSGYFMRVCDNTATNDDSECTGGSSATEDALVCLRAQTDEAAKHAFQSLQFYWLTSIRDCLERRRMILKCNICRGARVDRPCDQVKQGIGSDSKRKPPPLLVRWIRPSWDPLRLPRLLCRMCTYVYAIHESFNSLQLQTWFSLNKLSFKAKW